MNGLIVQLCLVLVVSKPRSAGGC